MTRLESLKLFKPSTDKCKFHDHVDQHIHLNVKLKNPDAIDLAVNNLTEIIQMVAWSQTLKSQPSSHYPLTLGNMCSIIVDKRCATASYQRICLPSDTQKYNKLTNHLKKITNKYKSESFVNFLSNLSSKYGSLWRATRKMCKYKTSNTPIKNSDGSHVITDPVKSELFKVHLSNISQPHPDIISYVNSTVVYD